MFSPSAKDHTEQRPIIGHKKPSLELWVEVVREMSKTWAIAPVLGCFSRPKKWKARQYAGQHQCSKVSEVDLP